MQGYTREFTLRRFSHDPYPYYDTWREISPVLWDETVDAWLITGYRQINSLLANPQLSSDLADHFLERVPKTAGACPAIRRNLASWILYLDPPEHTRLRKCAAPPLSRASIADLEPAIRQGVESLLDSVQQMGPEVDLVADFTEPVSAHGLFAFFKADLAPQESTQWAHRFARFIGCLRQTARGARQAEQAIEEIEAHFRPLLKLRPSAFLQHLASCEGLSEAEALATCSQLLLAGQDTTVGLLGNGLLALLLHPEALSQLVENPKLMGSAVEELLRYDCPSQLTSRLAQQDIEFEGQVIREGQTVNLFLGAANRDPSRFERPDSLCLDRANNRHLAFGRGTHFCVGASLARLQSTIALERLLARFPKLELAQRSFSREQNWVVRNLKSLRVRLW